MLGRMLITVAVGLTIFAAPTKSSAQNVSPAEAQAIAKDAYIYSYAMMESYQTWRTQAVDKSANGYVGGFNVFRHYSEPFTPDNKDIVTPNNDRPYSWAWLDLRAEPMVVSVPAVPKDRYYVMQWIDRSRRTSPISVCVRRASTRGITWLSARNGRARNPPASGRYSRPKPRSSEP